MMRKTFREVCYMKNFDQQLLSFRASYSLLYRKRHSSTTYCMNPSQKQYKKIFPDYHKADQSFMNMESSIRNVSTEPSKEEKTTKETPQKTSKKVSASTPVVVPERPETSLSKRVWDEIVHYYHGFRLLFNDIRISSRLLWKILFGRVLSRREHRQLVRTVSDLFRLVPFSVFLIIPFMELLLPVVIKLFPQLLPSTFQTQFEKEKQFKVQLKLKIDTAKFLKDALNEMAFQAKETDCSRLTKEFVSFFEKIRASDQFASNKDIIKFSKLFEDEITLDNLDRASLVALCRLLELQPFGTNNFMRFQLRMKLRSLKADDQMIVKEGIDSLTVSELQAACRERGMKAFGMPESSLRSQLQQWLELNLDEKIPPSLLLLSRALYLPDTLSTPEQLKATLSTLPDTAATEAKVKIDKIEGKVDNKTKLELIQKEEEAIIKEAKELAQEMLDKQKEVEREAEFEADTHIESLASYILNDDIASNKERSEVEAVEKGNKDKKLSKEDLDALEQALENVAIEKKKLLIEKGEIENLKEEMVNYKTNIEDMKDRVLEAGHKELNESKAASRLSEKVIKMISKMDNLLKEMSTEEENLLQQIEDKVVEGLSALKEKDDIISINELIRKMKTVSDDTRLQRIADVLAKMDVDHDGFVEVDHVFKVLKLLGEDDVKVTSKQINEIIELLLKEDSLKLEEKIKKHQKQMKQSILQRKRE